MKKLVLTFVIAVTAAFAQQAVVRTDNALLTRSVMGVFRNSPSTLTAGTTAPLYAGCTTIAIGGTVQSMDIHVDAGTATFKVWRNTSSTTDPTVADSLNTSGIAISTGTTLHSTTFTDFAGGTAPVFATNDKVCIQLSAVSGSVTSATFQVNYR